MSSNLKGRLQEVWTNLLDFAEGVSPEALEDVRDKLNEWLDSWHGEDYFGTEGQCDPRGDARETDMRPKI